MGLFDKLKEILFDEETVEIPVITKEKETSEKKKTTVPSTKKEDEVIIQKIEKVKEDEDLFDMPKLKEEAKEEVRTSTFTFPVFDDEELEVKDISRSSKKKKEEEPVSNKNTRKFDYLSSTDYKIKRENKDTRGNSRISSVTSTPEKKPFTLSPIISPVYGILNENYKKEDIVTRAESATRLSVEKVDLDSVRKKAYGSIEEEIEVTLSKPSPNIDILDEVPTKEELELDDDGISIDDLLVDNSSAEELFEIEEIPAEEEIEINNEKEDEKKENNAIGEEDLFDLIDSLYAGKGEN